MFPLVYEEKKLVVHYSIVSDPFSLLVYADPALLTNSDPDLIPDLDPIPRLKVS
jgi:hypothetical protein